MIKPLLIFAGSLSLTIGIIGIFIPVLPSTPFFLLTTGLYLKSSDRLYQTLTKNRLIGPYITDFRIKKGMTKKSKIYAICIMWLMIALSFLLFIKLPLIKLVVLFIGVSGTFVMGFFIPTVNNTDN